MNVPFRLSLASNLLLAGAVVFLLWREPSPPGTPPGPAARAPVAPIESPVQASAEAGEPARSAGAAQASVPAASSPTPAISRDILVSALREDFNRRWDRRFAELEKQHAPRPVPPRAYIELGRLRDAEQIRELKAALGEAGYQAWHREETLRTVNSAGLELHPHEAEHAYRLQHEFDEEHRLLQMAMEDGLADPADVATLQTQAMEARDRALAKLLGPQRYQEMRGLAPPMAEIHWRYGDLNPTPAQAHAALQADEDYRAREAALSRRLGENPGAATTITLELKALNDAREENLRRIFGAAAYDDLKRKNDSTFQMLRQYAGAWALRENEIQSVYQTLASFHDEANRTRSAAALREAAGQPVDWRATHAAIERARHQAEAGLQSVIGADRLQRLKRNGLLTPR
jgi:hypothetical protein